MLKSSTGPMRLGHSLVETAKREGLIHKRSAPMQIEYWAELGRAVEHVLDMKDVFAVANGLKKVRLESAVSAGAEPSRILADLTKARKNGSLSQKVTHSDIYFEASPGNPGLLDKVDSATGSRQTGRFSNGVFNSNR